LILDAGKHLDDVGPDDVFPEDFGRKPGRHPARAPPPVASRPPASLLQDALARDLVVPAAGLPRAAPGGAERPLPRPARRRPPHSQGSDRDRTRSEHGLMAHRQDRDRGPAPAGAPANRSAHPPRSNSRRVTVPCAAAASAGARACDNPGIPATWPSPASARHPHPSGAANTAPGTGRRRCPDRIEGEIDRLSEHHACRFLPGESQVMRWTARRRPHRSLQSGPRRVSIGRVGRILPYPAAPSLVCLYYVNT
jgi:hypothetical protein